MNALIFRKRRFGVKKAILVCVLFTFLLVSVNPAFDLTPQQASPTKEALATQESAQEKAAQKPPEKKEKKFEDVVKDAQKIDGLFNLYKKDDKLFMEIQPSQLGKLYLYIPTLWTSIGYGGTGSYLNDQVFYLEKLDKKVLLVWKNTRYVAKESSEYKRNLQNVVPHSIRISWPNFRSVVSLISAGCSAPCAQERSGWILPFPII